MDFGYHKLYINGELTEAAAGEKFTVVCPGTEESVADIAWASSADAEYALKSAQRGFELWSALSLKERTEWMHKLRAAVIEKQQLLRESIMYEMGKTWEGTEEDYETVINALQWYPEEMKRTRDQALPDEDNTFSHQLVSQPAGVVVAYLAWNFPLLNLGFKLGPALAAGCSLIIKPSPVSPLSAYLIGEICYEIGLPPGVVNILCGPDAEIGSNLSGSKIPRVITMIGSSATGRRVIADSATSIKKISMELGGNAPAMVFEDADLDQAVQEIAALKFGNTGQVCVSPNRIFIHKTIFNEFEEKFLEKARAVRVGFGKADKPTMGPLVNSQARERIQEMVADALEKGAEIICGGKIPDGQTRGYFYEPTVIKNVTAEMRIVKEEVFGPIATLIPFEGGEEIVEQANDTEHGLAAYLYTRDVNRIRYITEKLQFGDIMVNGFKYAIYLPHGGIKESGVGKDCSHLALDDYLVVKRITIKH